MQVFVYQSNERLIESVSEILNQTIKETNGPIGLATGSTFEPVYKHFLANYELPGEIILVALDEYSGIPVDHPSSFRETLLRQLVIPAGLTEKNLLMPPATDNQEQLDAFESRLSAIGPLAIQLLGIGTNGHIAFNEPGSESNSRTRKVRLSEETIEANKKHFEGEMPSFAITQGIATIREARKLLLVATGISKAKALATMFAEPSTPASHIADHPGLTLIVDTEAASLIPERLREIKD